VIMKDYPVFDWIKGEMKKAYIKTYGCQMNVHDSEKMAGVLLKEGFAMTEDQREADVVIYNTCSIREKAEQKFLSDLGRTRRLKLKRPEMKIAVAGCVAQQRGRALLRQAPHVDYVLGPQNISAVGEMVRGGQAVALEDNPLIAERELPALRKEGKRAWVAIMYGCDNYCSYCVVPHTRGRERSRPSESIVREVRALAGEGFPEVTLLGQNVNSYRSDVEFPGLLRKLNGVEGIERIRFVTSHPRDLSDGLVEAMAALDSVCEHIHLPLQSGSTRVLAAMNRGYTRDEYMEKIRRLRGQVPGIAITSDIIAGFPGEGDEDHRDTVSTLREIEYDGIFAFRFSPRPGTKAAGIEEQLPETVKQERLKEILDVQDEITLKRNRPLVGTEAEILVEGPSDTGGLLTGRTRTNKIVNFEGQSVLVGRLVRVRIIEAKRHSLLGARLGRLGEALPQVSENYETGNST
jgi:tRNA-2-methylthio-N6-dimethylallyladenosine synthase